MTLLEDTAEDMQNNIRTNAEVPAEKKVEEERAIILKGKALAGRKQQLVSFMVLLGQLTVTALKVALLFLLT